MLFRSANEYAIIKEHVNLGYQIVKDADIDERVKSAILLHHEKCDGSGCPEWDIRAFSFACAKFLCAVREKGVARNG